MLRQSSWAQPNSPLGCYLGAPWPRFWPISPATSWAVCWWVLGCVRMGLGCTQVAPSMPPSGMELSSQASASLVGRTEEGLTLDVFTCHQVTLVHVGFVEVWHLPHACKCEGFTSWQAITCFHGLCAVEIRKVVSTVDGDAGIIELPLKEGRLHRCFAACLAEQAGQRPRAALAPATMILVIASR